MQSVGLLIVACKVLGAHAYALTLYAVDHGRTDKTCHERVFRIVFEVAAAERRAHDVHARTQNDVATVFQRLVTHGLAHALHQFGVPCRCQQRADGEARAVVGVRIVGAFFRDMNARRTVGKHRVWDAQPFNLGRIASRAEHDGPGVRVRIRGKSEISVAERVAHQQVGFLLDGHVLDHLVDVLGRQSGLRRSRSCHHSRSDNKFCFHTVFYRLILTDGKNTSFFSDGKEFVRFSASELISRFL